MDEQQGEIKMARLWGSAHMALPDLAALMAKEKGLPSLTYTDAASIAILEALARRVQDKQGKAKQQAAPRPTE